MVVEKQRRLNQQIFKTGRPDRRSCVVPRLRSALSLLFATACLVSANVGGSATTLASELGTATSPFAERDALFRRSLKNPTDVPLALSYAKACVAVHDYEGAIGALERVLYFVPEDKAVQAQLGLLYAQLQSPQMAKQHFDSASSGEGLDPTIRAKIATVEPVARDAVAGSHLFGTLQGGLRYQTNAAFNPDNNILRLSSQDYLLTHPRNRGSDGNGFELAQIGYDYDLGNQRGDVVEARIAGYATQQFRFTDLNVGLYDVTVGPRFFLSPENMPGWSVKPYAAGGQVFLAGQRYLASGGAGIIADMPVLPNLLLQPGAEVRRVSFSNVSVFSSLNSGDTATASLAASAVISPSLSVIGRLFYTRDSASFDYQSLNNYAEELALVARLPAPLTFASVPWTVSPYLKLLQSRFDAPNPFIDPAITRHDNELQVGLVLDTPLSARFDLVTNVQYASVASNIPNYRLHNFSVLSGPLVHF